MLDILLKFTRKAGLLMQSQSCDISSLGCKDASVASIVTKTDIAISDLFAQTVKKNFSKLNYMIIDEEKITQYGDNPFTAINSTEYQFAIDPIDGTIQYANRHPLYGISIGVYKKTKPLYGIIYLPFLRELLYSDGKKAYLVQNAFKRNAVKIELKPKEKSASPIILAGNRFWRLTENYSPSEALVFDYFSAVSHSLYPLTDRAKASCLNCKLWDIAGVMAIAKCLKMNIFAYSDGKICNMITEEFFDTNMQIKKPSLLCHKSDWAKVRSIIKPLS